MRYELLKKFGVRFLGFFLVLSILGNVFAVSSVKTVDAAAFVPVNDLQGNLLLGTIAKTNGELVVKEYILDQIAWLALNAVLQAMSQSIISWINSGFEGSPAFITDFEGFLTDIADKVAGNLIWGSELKFLCSPFELNIRYALDFQYGGTRDFTRSRCSITDIANNIERFTDGDFISGGGWDNWFKITSSPENNQYGALLLAQDELTMRLGNAKFQETNLLDWGKGFMTLKECTDDGCSNITPGTAIENQLNQTLGSGMRRVEIADELNEIIAALFTQLVSQALSEGIGSLTSSGYTPTGGTYYDALKNDVTSGGYSVNTGNNIIQSALDLETSYYAQRQSVITIIAAAETYKADQYGAMNICHTGDLSTNLQQVYVDALTDASSALTNISQLQPVLDAYTAAGNDSFAQGEAIQDYMDIVALGNLHSGSDVVAAQAEIPTVQSLVSAFVAEIDLACQ